MKQRQNQEQSTTETVVVNKEQKATTKTRTTTASTKTTILSNSHEFSKKELEQLARSKQRQNQEQSAAVASIVKEQKTATTTITKTKTTSTDTSNTKATNLSNNNSYEDYAEKIRRGSVESFINAHNQVKESNKAQGVENSRDMDGMLLCMLPMNVWFGDFLSDSRADADDGNHCCRRCHRDDVWGCSMMDEIVPCPFGFDAFGICCTTKEESLYRCSDELIPR